VELGTSSCLRGKAVVRAIDAQTNRDERQVDRHRDGTVVTQVRAFFQVGHGLSSAASNTELERLHEPKLRL